MVGEVDASVGVRESADVVRPSTVTLLVVDVVVVCGDVVVVDVDVADGGKGVVEVGDCPIEEIRSESRWAFPA